MYQGVPYTAPMGRHDRQVPSKRLRTATPSWLVPRVVPDDEHAGYAEAWKRDNDVVNIRNVQMRRSIPPRVSGQREQIIVYCLILRKVRPTSYPPHGNSLHLYPFECAVEGRGKRRVSSCSKYVRLFGLGLHLVDVYLECSEAAKGRCELGLAEVMEGIVLKYSVPYRDRTRSGGQSPPDKSQM